MGMCGHDVSQHRLTAGSAVYFRLGGSLAYTVLLDYQSRLTHCFPATSIRLHWLKARSSDHAQDICQLPGLCDSEGPL